jgi:hypothetical protein
MENNRLFVPGLEILVTRNKYLVLDPRQTGACVSVLFFLAIVGCGGSGVAPVSGRVTLDGRPLEHADVTFQPEGSLRPSVGRTDADGRYELAYKRGELGALVGEHTVRIYVSPELVTNPPRIPARYDRESELRREVKPGDNVFDFNLESGEK